jgi:lipopolysaccharide/colanic/teichoic acid biosynthesis glycosyltransferase
MIRFVFLLGADLLLLLLAFGLTHMLNYGHMNISGSKYHLLQHQILVWLAMSLAARKFSRLPHLSFIAGTGLLLKTGIAMLFCLSLLIVGLQMMHFGRTMAYGAIIVFLMLETAGLALYRWVRGPVAPPGSLPVKSVPASLSGSLLFLDGALVVGAFYGVTYIKRGGFSLSQPYDDILLLLLGLWLIGSVLTRKFNRDNFDDFFSALGPAIKTALFMAVGLAFLIYFLRLVPVSRLQALGPLPLFLAMESLVFLLYVNYRRHGRINGDLEDTEQVRALLDAKEDRALLDPAPVCRVQNPAADKLRYALDFFDPRIFAFINAHVELQQVDRADCALFSTDNMFNLNILEPGRGGLIVNLHKLNDMRWFNRYFLLCHERLRPGGCLVGKAHTISMHRDYFRSKYPGFPGAIFYVLSFIWGRVFPKLPWLQKFYFAVTKGRNRMVSRAEILGRLCFCGFEIVAEEEIGHKLFFIARKIKRPSLDQNPTYGPLVRLKRTGQGGRPITVYKFRTMYPFSEYLQEYVFNMNGTRDGDKIINDFRITGWGKILRRLWLDELPMLYNWLRGDLKLVGVRPLSDHKLSTYPAALQKKRNSRVKPGLLPPFYADRPKTVEEFFRTEGRYLDAYQKRPVITDAKYFWKIVWNIVVKQARSG